MKPKTARRKLTKMNIAFLLKEEGVKRTRTLVKPYMMALKRDLKNPASARVYEYVRRMFFG